MQRTPVGVDIAKSVFQVHHLDLETGEIVNKAIKRGGFLEYFASRSPCLIGMEAIAEAASRPTMRYVAINSVEQQDIQSMHRIRSLLMRDRIAQINQIRGLLAEYGVVIAQTPLKVRQQLPAILDDQDNERLCRSKRRTVEIRRYKVADERIDEDAEPGVGQGTETLALSAGGDSDVRALVRRVSAESASS